MYDTVGLAIIRVWECATMEFANHLLFVEIIFVCHINTVAGNRVN